jgi:hypothetical protein
MRWSDVKRDPKGSRPANKSCGCLEEAAFWKYVYQKFNEIPQAERFAIFTEAQVATSTSAVARRHGLDKYTFTQVITRTHEIIKIYEALALKNGLDFMFIYRKNKNRFRNENGQTNCFLSIGPVGGGAVEISGAFAAETVCQQRMGSREIDYGGVSRCGARGVGASEKESARTA